MIHIGNDADAFVHSSFTMNARRLLLTKERTQMEIAGHVRILNGWLIGMINVQLATRAIFLERFFYDLMQTLASGVTMSSTKALVSHYNVSLGMCH